MMTMTKMLISGDDKDVDLRLADERELACRRTSTVLLLLHTSLESTLMLTTSSLSFKHRQIIKSVSTIRKGGGTQLANLEAGPKENHSSSPEVNLRSIQMKWKLLNIPP